MDFFYKKQTERSWVSGYTCQGGQSEGSDGPNLLLVVHQAVFDDLHQGPQVWEDGATHQDGDLLDDLDASVPGLPRLLRLAHGLLGRQITGISEGSSVKTCIANVAL